MIRAIVKSLKKLKCLCIFILAVIFLFLTLIWGNTFFLPNLQDKPTPMSAHINADFKRNPQLFVLVLSDRDSFESREMIRQTWASGHNNVFFMTGSRYCQYPPEQRVPGTCTWNNKSVSTDRLQKYQAEEERNIGDIRKEARLCCYQ